MISYKIVSNGKNRQPNPAYKKVTILDPDYKEVVLERHFTNLKGKVGDRIRLVGTSKFGVIKEIIKENSRVVWYNNRPKYIVIEMEDGKQYMVSPKQFKFIKGRSCAN